MNVTRWVYVHGWWKAQSRRVNELMESGTNWSHVVVVDPTQVRVVAVRFQDLAEAFRGDLFGYYRNPDYEWMKP
jgi:hypothetical protein